MTNEELIKYLIDLITKKAGMEHKMGGQRANLFRHEIDSTASELLAKLNLCDELQAIVDKLPKTADGVPITPGMKLWIDLGWFLMSKHAFTLLDYTAVRLFQSDDNSFIASFCITNCDRTMTVFMPYVERSFHRHPVTSKTVEETEQEQAQ
jgi:hypothetical protein